MRIFYFLAIGLIALTWGLGSSGEDFQWQTANPEDHGMSSVKLEELRDDLIQKGTKAFLVIRNDKILCEWYANGHGRNKRHYTASMAKALVGGVSLAVAVSDGLISLDDKASHYISQWKDDSERSQITIRHLGSHTSGIQDALVPEEEEAGVGQSDFSGWEGDFWRWRSRETSDGNDAFTLSRDTAPVLFPPGSGYHYSNPGIGMLSYAVTASLKKAGVKNIRTLLRDRVMSPIGVPDDEWSCGYGKTEEVDGLPLVASWGGGSYSANATARVARLMLRNGDWQGKHLISAEAVKQTVSDADTPNNGGMGWWANSNGDFGKAPESAFSGQGAGHQVVLVVPDLDLICVRNGALLSSSVDFRTALRQFLFDPLMNSVTDPPELSQLYTQPYPPSQVITGIKWAPEEEIVRQAEGGDNWPVTWADDDRLYTAYGDGWGFEPRVPNKLSMGFASVVGPPDAFQGSNIRSPSGEDLGDDVRGKKASGILMVDGVLYLLARNAGNAQLAWSDDYARSWKWADWKFTNSFGYPIFLNFGKNYEGARDGFVYIYSHDSDSAYESADRMVLARVPKDGIRDHGAYEYFKRVSDWGDPFWTKTIEERGAVFSHPGHCFRAGITYSPGLQRYLWSQIHPQSEDSRGPRFQGGFGVYEAPEPWGPWRTVFYTPAWDVGPGETSSFPSKWMSEDGKTAHLVFSGDDYFSVRRATLTIQSAD